jgi:hypothetical protein
MSYRANDLVRTMTGKIGHVREILPDSIVRVAIIVRIPNDHAPSPALQVVARYHPEDLTPLTPDKHTTRKDTL